MEKKLYVVVLLLLLLVVDGFIVRSKANTCYAKSRKYRGRCYLKRHAGNCKTICKKEKFKGGLCSRTSCFCWKKCHPLFRSPPSPEIGSPELSPPGKDNSCTPLTRDLLFMNHIKQRLGSGSGLELLLPHGDLLRPVKADEEGEKGKQDRGKRGLKWRKLQTKPRPQRGRRSEPAARPGLHSIRNPRDRHGDIDFGRSAINDRHGSSGLIELMSRKHRESSIIGEKARFGEERDMRGDDRSGLARKQDPERREMKRDDG
ncbi:defensin protein [Striga asiatica]|uniref:Defensin protein n=1 Tax=Striga asiatica TaxID=4170 RepID=A0A5A7P5P2_STRAF|nr:defensin protein [Striga asiatica]